MKSAVLRMGIRCLAGIVLLSVSACTVGENDFLALEDAHIAALRRDIEAPVTDCAGIQSALSAARSYYQLVAGSRHVPAERDEFVSAVSMTVDDVIQISAHCLHHRIAIDLSGNEYSVAAAKDGSGITAEIATSPEGPLLTLSSAAGGSITGPPEQMAITFGFEMAIVQVTGTVRLVSNDIGHLIQYYIDLGDCRSILAKADRSLQGPSEWPLNVTISIEGHHVDCQAGDVRLNDALEDRIPRFGNWGIEFEPGARMTIRRLRVLVGEIP